MRQTAQQGGSARALPPLLVDGARDPARVPEEAAIAFAMTTLLALPGEWAHPLTRARITAIGLSTADREILREELGRGRTALRALEDEARAAIGGAVEAQERHERLLGIWFRRDALAADAYARLQDLLSAEGRARLRTYVEGRKRHIRSES